MINLRRMSECSFETALDAWNRGFQGYAVDLTQSLDQLLTRITYDELSLERSLIAFDGDQIVGFLMNAFRESDGRRLAWNGGTGVVPEWRGRGVGRLLMDATLKLYQTERVDVALLEALSNNHPAIELYKKCGYEIQEELTLLRSESEMVNFAPAGNYSVKHVDLTAVGQLEFYRYRAPWQCQWKSLLRSHGEACVVYDDRSSPVAYALYKRQFDNQGKVSRIALYQCEVIPEREDAADIAAHALQEVFGTARGKVLRSTHDFRKSNQTVVDLLINAGFTTFIEQVHMMKRVST